MTKYLIGIQPTGRLHIGNYLGCIRKGLELQENPENNVTWLIANYHSMTTDNFSEITEIELKKLGCKNIVHQTPEYTELFWKIACKMNLGILQKMPQFKDKKEKTSNDLGILLYPVLMAADIIINDPDFIIVGKDQTPHIDLCNDIAKKIGITKHFKYIFGDVDKIYSLKNSTKKMSKSDPENTILYLFDEDYRAKIMGAVTDEQGVKNLAELGKYFELDYNLFNEDKKLFKEALIEKVINKFSTLN
jgi:tryptophanyl-tRNA synthetase